MRKAAPILVSSVFFVAAAVAAPGLSPGELFPDARFDPAIPTQQQVLGFGHGARPLRHAELLRYLEALDEASPRASMQTYAETWEGRRMVVFMVSDEETARDFAAFRDAHVSRLDPRTRPAADDATALDGAKAVAWMAYGIHGDELSSVDAAAAVAYRLVAGEDDESRRLREGLVVLIDPCENPDGRDRYLAQTASFAHAVPTPDLEDLSHTAVWPWGRGNHYLFDLNRDWFSMVHPESTRSQIIASWQPQLMVDSHEMGPNSSYLFSPPRHPFNPHLPPSQLDWWQAFGDDQARALDSRGYPYFTREWNEEFFPGYGSSWASYVGAVGILYEMSRTTGTLVRKREGTIRTYPQAVEHQVASSMANLETLLDNRAGILTDLVADRRRAAERARGGTSVGAWLLPEGRHPERTRALVRLLGRQGIEAHVIEPAALRGTAPRDARTGDAVDPATLGGTVWLVAADQPMGPLVRVLLDPHVPMDSAFLAEEREYQELGKGTRLYEVTAWSLPLAYGVEALWTARPPDGASSPAPTPRIRGSLEGTGDDVLAWFVDGINDRSGPFVADLLQQGVGLMLAERDVRVDGQDWPKGSLLIRREGNPDDIVQRLQAAAERHGVDVHGTRTGKATEGPDLGGSLFHPLIEPRVAVFTGWPISPSDYGAVWHLLDEVLGLRFTARDLGRFGSTDLRRYNVLVFPPAFGGASGYRTALGDSGLAALREWLEGGGTAIGLGSGAEFLADEKSGLTRARLRRQALDRFPPVVFGPDAATVEAAGRMTAVGLRAPKDAAAAGDVEERGDSKRGRSRAQEASPRSPYDVAPLLGAGARPFAAGVDIGTPVTGPPVDLAEWVEAALPPGQTKPTDDDLARADRRLRRLSPQGAFVRVELDPESWLTWGIDAELDALVRARDTLVAEGGVTVVARFPEPDRMHLGGLLWPEAAGRLAHTAYATREAKGRGQVILFLNPPEFRGWTLGTRRLLTHAVLYGPGMGTRWASPW